MLEYLWKVAWCFHPPRPGSEHAKIIRKTLSYLQNKQAFMDYR